MYAFPILKTTAKSVQTTAEVCADYTCSLYRLRRGLQNRKGTLYFYLAYMRLFDAFIGYKLEGYHIRCIVFDIKV